MAGLRVPMIVQLVKALLINALVCLGINLSLKECSQTQSQVRQDKSFNTELTLDLKFNNKSNIFIYPLQFLIVSLPYHFITFRLNIPELTY